VETLNTPSSCLAVYKEQLMALGLGTFLGDPDSTTKAFTDLKMELDKEKVA
jgi:hypothetical protein